MGSGQDDARPTDRHGAAGGGGTTGPAAASAGDAARARGGASGTAPQRRGERSAVGWFGLLVASVLTVWQIVFAVSHQGLEPGDQDVYAAVSLFVTLVLSVGAMVLGLVALSQRRGPGWPAIVALAVGAQVFLVTVAMWVGDLASGTV